MDTERTYIREADFGEENQVSQVHDVEESVTDSFLCHSRCDAQTSDSRKREYKKNSLTDNRELFFPHIGSNAPRIAT